MCAVGVACSYRERATDTAIPCGVASSDVVAEPPPPCHAAVARCRCIIDARRMCLVRESRDNISQLPPIYLPRLTPPSSPCLALYRRQHHYCPYVSMYVHCSTCQLTNAAYRDNGPVSIRSQYDMNMMLPTLRYLKLNISGLLYFFLLFCKENNLKK